MPNSIPRKILSIAKSKDLIVSVRIGKNGISEQVISEISSQLSKRNIVKVKTNKGIASDSSERKQLFEKLSHITSSKLIFNRGNIAVFWKD